MSRPPGSGGAPLWLRAVHRLERAIGGPIESAVHSDPYFDVVTDLLRARRSYGRRVEGISRQLLHLVNLPAGSDIRRVREQLARVERRLAQLGDELERLETHPSERVAPRASERLIPREG
jgi:hypothetical protein